MGICMLELLLAFLGLRMEAMRALKEYFNASWLSFTKSNAYIASGVLGNAARFFDAPVHDYYLVEGTPVILAYEKNGQYVTTIVREHVRNAPIEWTVHSMVVASTPANPFSVEHSSYRLVICDGFVLYDLGGLHYSFFAANLAG